MLVQHCVAAKPCKNTSNATYKEHIKMTPWEMMHGREKDISNFRAFRCMAWVYQNKDRRGNTPASNRFLCAVKAIYLRFATDHSMRV
jgi:hypothetical protein